MRAIRKLFRPETGRQACVSAVAKAVNGGNSANNHVGLLILQPIQLQDIYATLGYRAGTNVISAVRSAAQNVLAKDDVVLQLDDGKLAIILSSLCHPNHALLAANKIRNACEQNVDLGGRELALRLRVGIAILAQPGETPESALQRAELALREAGETDQSVLMRGEPETDRVLRDWEIEKDLSIALSNGDLELFFQPKIDVGSQALCGAEGLLRWEQKGLTPDAFIPVAEKTGQITELTRFALQSAVRQLAEWPRFLNEIGIAVNLSATDLHRGDLPAVINGALDIWSINPRRLTLEVTETHLMEDPVAAHAILQATRELGCRVSIDDFGTGYSSLAYFKKIPADELKIDKSFVFSMLTDVADRNIVSHIISLAHCFGLKVVAEGVENQETLECLSEMNCDYVQGFHFSKALPPDDFVEWAKRFRKS
jgi:EAL domain-containing protein (putative c-di-GMP-specific phosphodiesterase class I)/GGDEF domain-containing protein